MNAENKQGLFIFGATGVNALIAWVYIASDIRTHFLDVIVPRTISPLIFAFSIFMLAVLYGVILLRKADSIK